MKTTKGQVEELFGGPISEDPLISATYNPPFGKVTVWYRDAKDPDDLECNWNVSADTAISYYVSLGGLPIPAAGYNLKSFKREFDHVGDPVYTNRQLGISFVATQTQGGELIRAVRYSPPLAEIQCHCKKAHQ